MDLGLLETAVTLGSFKIVCSLFSIPTLRDSFNSVSFCCCCLVIFTDLSVTVFLAFLWWAKPWRPQFLVPDDVATLRLLLFLDHTYGAALLLTQPLVAVDTVCRLRWPLDSEKEGSLVGERANRLTSVRTGEESRGTSCERGAEAGANCKETRRGQRDSLTHVPGFLCCLLVWVLCGCSGAQDRGLEALQAEACVRRGEPLSACLPDLLTVTMRTVADPARTLAALALSPVLALSMGLLRGGLGHGGTDAKADGRKEDTDGPWLSHGVVEVHAAHLNKATSSLDVRGSAEDGRVRQSSQTAHASTGTRLHLNVSSCGRQGLRDKSASAQGAALSSPCRQARTATGPARGMACVMGGMLTGLACTAMLCLLPPALAVNAVLIGTADTLTEWSLSHVVSGATLTTKR